MNVFPPMFSRVLSSNDVQSVEPNRSLPQSCHSDGKKGFDFTERTVSAKLTDDGKIWKRQEDVDKKLLHKLIEKERRKQMKSRYSDLRSLIPGENFKGKSSITDQLSVATEYIHRLEKKVEELTKKREKLKLNETQYCYTEEEEFKTFPVVNVSYVGSLVLVTTCSFREQIALSTLLFALEEEGLHIISASSFAPDDKVYNSIHCKVVLDKEKFNSSTKVEKRLGQLLKRKSIGDV